MRRTRHGPVQRWLCRSCGFRFSESTADFEKKVDVLSQNIEQPNPGKNLLQTNVFQREFSGEPLVENPSFERRENIASHTSSKQTIVEKRLYAFPDYSSECRVSATEGEAKNLVKSETRQKWAAGATANVKAQLIDFAWHLKREGYNISTITTYSSLLRKLLKLNADLLDPESVKDALARNELKPNTKACMIGAYTSFANYCGLKWKPPKYQWQTRIPFIPEECEIDSLIAGCSKQISAILQTLKETAMRIGEACRLKWTNINVENHTITLNEPEKGGNPGIFKVSAKLIGMLQTLPKKHERVFGKSSKQNKTWLFKLQRSRLARKLGNPRLNEITFHTLRHWKATTEYHKTKDIIHVQQLLRHRDIKSTMIYITVEQAIYQETNDEFISKVAETAEEAQQLVDVGFEYVCTTPENLMLFRRRK